MVGCCETPGSLECGKFLLVDNFVFEEGMIQPIVC